MRLMLSDIIKDWLAKSVILAVRESQDQGISTIFPVKKKNQKKIRPVINLKPFNLMTKSIHFKMENLKATRSILRSGNWCTKIDIKDAFLHVPVHPSRRRYLRFRWENQLYEFQALPFGLNHSPRLFTKVMRPIAQYLRAEGIRCMFYIDDILIVADSITQANLHSKITTDLLTSLGFLINWEKSILQPTQVIEFLGTLIDTRSMDFRVPDYKAKNFRRMASRILSKAQNGQQFSARALARVVGKLNATADMCWSQRRHTWGLMHVKNQALRMGGWERKISLSLEARHDLMWWTTFDPSKPDTATSIVTVDPTVVFSCDASSFGWGGHWDLDGTPRIARGF
jgi:hypothetical protein